MDTVWRETENRVFWAHSRQKMRCLCLLATGVRAVLFFLYSLKTSQAHWTAVEQKCGEVISTESKN